MYRTTITLEDGIAEVGKRNAGRRGFSNSFSAYIAWLIQRDEAGGVAREQTAMGIIAEAAAKAFKPSPKRPESKRASKRKVGVLRDIEEVSLTIWSTIPAGWAEDRSTCKPLRTVMVRKGKYPSDAFGLEVSGDSMNAATGKFGPVRSGETVVLVPFACCDQATGQIVAALVDGQTTLKRLKCKPDDRCMLLSESTNPDTPRSIDAQHDLVIKGVVVGKL